MTTVHDALRAWAKGLYDREAAVELLIRQGKAIYPGAPWLRTSATTLEGAPLVYIDVDELVYEAGAWSGGERRIVDVAASLLSQDHPVNLSDAVSNLDRDHQELVLAAIAHAAGSHQGTQVTVDEHGRPNFHRAGSLFGWPGDDAASSDASPRPQDPGSPAPDHVPGL